MKYTTIIFILFSVALFFSGCSTLSHRTTEIDSLNQDVIDVDNFDPADFMMKVEKKFKERKKSEINQFYLLGNETVEYRLVKDTLDNITNQDDFEQLKDLQGNKYFVHKQPVIDSSDIEGVFITQSFYNGIERKDIIVLIKKDSWTKVHDITVKLRGCKIGVFKGTQLLMAPTLNVTVDTGIKMYSRLNDLDNFIKGFILTELPSEEQQEKHYIDWLERRAIKYPKDNALNLKLAKKYKDNEVKDCKKIFDIYKKVLFDDVDRFPYFNELRKCYYASGDYDDAINTYKKLLSDLKLDAMEEATIRSFLADILFVNENKEESLNELHTALKLIESSTLDYEWIERSAHRDKIRREFKEKKEGFAYTIRKMIDMIEKKE
jgi:tetratricopeptide (TPR) repeat protein